MVVMIPETKCHNRKFRRCRMGCLKVLERGEAVRFANEMLTRDMLSEAILSQTEKKVFIVFDQSVRESLAAIENYAHQGLLTSAESLSELADELKIPVSAFVATM